MNHDLHRARTIENDVIARRQIRAVAQSSEFTDGRDVDIRVIENFPGGYELRLPYAGIFLTINLFFPTRYRQCPEIFVLEGLNENRFCPLLKSLVDYDPEDTLSTMRCLQEFRQKYANFQLKRLVANPAISPVLMEQVDRLHGAFTDGLQVQCEDNRLLWSVKLPIHLPLEDGTFFRSGVVVRGKNSLTNFRRSKPSFEVLPEVADHVKRTMHRELSLPDWQEHLPIDEYLVQAADRFQRSIILVKKISDITSMNNNT